MKRTYLFLMQIFFTICLSGFVLCSKNTEQATNSSPNPDIYTKATIPDRETLQSQMKKVADWQIANFTCATEGKPGYLHDYGIDAWTNATLYLGMTEWAKVSKNSEPYFTWLKNIGDNNGWKIPDNFKDNKYYQLYHADELCIGQFYFAMYNIFKDERMIQSTKERVDWIMNNPPDTNPDYRNKQSWTWIDALFMAPPVFIELAIKENNPQYMEFMQSQFQQTYNHLYNKKHGIFYRDSSYLTKKEDNGKDVFWGRGNGWMAAGLVNILKLLPQDSQHRPFYQSLFHEFIPALVSLKDEDYYWHASLLDPDSYPSPETSATALITYAIAYGINENLLPRDEYETILANTWSKLNSFVNESGKLGFVQPIGADPKKVTEDMTAVYGVGAYLLAGSEIYRLSH